MNIFKKAVAASALALLACGSASATVITFDDFYSQAGASHYVPIFTYAASSYSDDGFSFASSGGVQIHKVTVGSLLSLDSTLGASVGVTTTLSDGGSAFSLSSLDLSTLVKQNVTFTAVTAAGATVQESFTTKLGTSKFTFSNPAFADVKSVSWTESTNVVKAYAVDNVVLAAVPEPETYAMLLAGLGLVGFLARRKKSA